MSKARKRRRALARQRYKTRYWRVNARLCVLQPCPSWDDITIGWAERAEDATR